MPNCGDFRQTLLLSVIFRHPVSPGTISNSSSRTPETPTLPNQAKVTLRGSIRLGKDRRGLSEMIPDPMPPEVKHCKERGRLCKNSQSKIYQKHSGRRLFLHWRVEPLKNFLEYLFPANSHCSLPHHTLEVRITALVQIIHQQ